MRGCYRRLRHEEDGGAARALRKKRTMRAAKLKEEEESEDEKEEEGEKILKVKKKRVTKATNVGNTARKSKIVTSDREENALVKKGCKTKKQEQVTKDSEQHLLSPGQKIMDSQESDKSDAASSDDSRKEVAAIASSRRTKSRKKENRPSESDSESALVTTERKMRKTVPKSGKPKRQPAVPLSEDVQSLGSNSNRSDSEQSETFKFDSNEDDSEVASFPREIKVKKLEKALTLPSSTKRKGKRKVNVKHVTSSEIPSEESEDDMPLQDYTEQVVPDSDTTLRSNDSVSDSEEATDEEKSIAYAAAAEGSLEMQKISDSSPSSSPSSIIGSSMKTGSRKSRLDRKSESNSANPSSANSPVSLVKRKNASPTITPPTPEKKTKVMSSKGGNKKDDKKLAKTNMKEIIDLS